MYISIGITSGKTQLIPVGPVLDYGIVRKSLAYETPPYLSYKPTNAVAVEWHLYDTKAAHRLLQS
jgi:hypothetical protein